MLMTYLDFGSQTIKVCEECLSEHDEGIKFLPWHDTCSACGRTFSFPQ